MHHFYNVMSTLSPILAWGFLGPSRSLQGQCAVFKVRLGMRVAFDYRSNTDKSPYTLNTTQPLNACTTLYK